MSLQQNRRTKCANDRLGFGKFRCAVDFGLSLVVAALSFANYLVGQEKWRFSQALRNPVDRIMIDLGLVLFCMGVAGSIRGTWEGIAWAVLALILVVRTWQDRKSSNR